MTDLSIVLPDFDTQSYIRLIPPLERNNVTVADLLTLESAEVAKRAQVPLLDVKRLSKAIAEKLQQDLGISAGGDGKNESAGLRKAGSELLHSWSTVSTLDDELDQALEGGIPIGYITEITGESGAGKTQFLLTLLLTAQLPLPQGLASPVMYISTESALPTQRIAQLLRSHPRFKSFPPSSRPSLDRIISITTPDLESQEHILRYQVPIAIQRHGVRLLIIDSIAANYRAEFERSNGNSTNTSGGANMAQRSSDLIKLGQFLRDLARRHNLAVVVSNQVADRFSSTSNSPTTYRQNSTQSSPLARRSGPGLPSSSIPIPSNIDNTPSLTPRPGGSQDPMTLDHQQRFFTGWGDDPYPSHATANAMKTPSLGLVWSTQIAARITLIKRPVYGQSWVEDGVRGEDGGELVLKRWRRWMKVVFAPHVGASGRGVEGAVEFEIAGEGIRSVSRQKENEEDTK